MTDNTKNTERAIANPRYKGATLAMIAKALFRPVKQKSEPKRQTVCGTPLVEVGRRQDEEAKASAAANK